MAGISFLLKCRWADRQMHEYFDNTEFECLPDEAQISRVEKNFEWLGAWFDASGATIIPSRITDNYHVRQLQLERLSRKHEPSEYSVSAWSNSMRRREIPELDISGI